jgi:hypothetical protein
MAGCSDVEIQNQESRRLGRDRDLNRGPEAALVETQAGREPDRPQNHRGQENTRSHAADENKGHNGTVFELEPKEQEMATHSASLHRNTAPTTGKTDRRRNTWVQQHRRPRTNRAHAGQNTVRAMPTTSSRPDRRPQEKENESGAQLTDQELAAKICGARDPCAGLKKINAT